MPSSGQNFKLHNTHNYCCNFSNQKVECGVSPTVRSTLLSCFASLSIPLALLLYSHPTLTSSHPFPPCKNLFPATPIHPIACFHFPSSVLQYVTGPFPLHSSPDCQCCLGFGSIPLLPQTYLRDSYANLYRKCCSLDDIKYDNRAMSDSYSVLTRRQVLFWGKESGITFRNVDEYYYCMCLAETKLLERIICKEMIKDKGTLLLRDIDTHIAAFLVRMQMKCHAANVSSTTGGSAEVRTPSVH